MGALLVLFLAPRGVFHDCGHAEVHGSGEKAVVSTPSHCAACDMVVPPFEQAPVAVAPWCGGHGIPMDTACPVSVASGHVCHAVARGPPARA